MLWKAVFITRDHTPIRINCMCASPGTWPAGPNKQYDPHIVIMVLGTGMRVNMTPQGVVLLSHMVLFIYAYHSGSFAYILTSVDTVCVRLWNINLLHMLEYSCTLNELLHFTWLILFCILYYFRWILMTAFYARSIQQQNYINKLADLSLYWVKIIFSWDSKLRLIENEPPVFVSDY